MQTQELMPVRRAATAAGVTPSWINRQIRYGNLPAERVGHFWLVRRADLEKWAKQRHRFVDLD